jgi:DNA-binding NarL/FixJ family response regulator
MNATAMKVLLVDDDEAVLTALEDALHQEPYEVLTTRSGEEALSLLQRTSVDVVVSDEEMPGIRGSELLALVRDKHPETTRLLLTGHATLDSAMRAINQGQVFQYVTKPIDTRRFTEILRAAVHLRLVARTTAQIWQGATAQHGAMSRYASDSATLSNHATQNGAGATRTANGVDLERAARTLLEASERFSPRTSSMPSFKDPVAAGVAKLLTSREHEVLIGLAAGWNPKEIAGKLNISPNTARNHVKSVYRKLGLHSRGELHAWVLEHLNHR